MSGKSKFTQFFSLLPFRPLSVAALCILLSAGCWLLAALPARNKKKKKSKRTYQRRLFAFFLRSFSSCLYFIHLSLSLPGSLARLFSPATSVSSDPLRSHFSR